MTFDEQVELRVVDDDGRAPPRDGAGAGRLQVRGPWMVRHHSKAAADATDADGRFDTGDVAVLHPDGTMRITDRAKDVIKSGDERISSVELENAAMGCSGVAEAAAIGVPHPRWDERPPLLVVAKPGAAVSEVDVLPHLADGVGGLRAKSSAYPRHLGLVPGSNRFHVLPAWGRTQRPWHGKRLPSGCDPASRNHAKTV